MNSFTEYNRFAAKEKLRKCIVECQAELNPPFRLSDATKWVESYFKREGGNIDCVPLFVQFIRDLGIISKAEKSKLNSKFIFNEARIRELFECVSPDMLRVSTKENIPSLPNCVSETTDNFAGEVVQAASQQDKLWLEEVLSRLACLLDLDRKDLISALPLAEISDLCGLSGKENVSLGFTNLGSFVRSNCLRSSEPAILHCQDHLVNAVALACLETLAKWPEGHTHQSELCEGFCVPHLILSNAFALAQTSCHDSAVALDAVGKIFELIFQNWPPSDLCPKGTTPSCSEHTASTTHAQEQRTPNLDESEFHGQKTTPQSLPPLATPLMDRSILFADDSRFLSCRPTARSSRMTSVRISKPELSDASGYDYEPLPMTSMLYSKCQPASVSRKPTVKLTVSCVGRSNSTDASPSSERGEHSPKSATHAIDSLTNQIACINFGRSRRRHSSFTTSARALPDRPVERSHELTLAAQLTLLLLPPLFYSRLRILVRSLQQVLLNHANLCPALVGGYHSSSDESSQNVSTHESTLSVLSELFANVLFPLQAQPNNPDWRVLVTRLLLCDSSGFLLEAPLNFVKYVQPVAAKDASTSPMAPKIPAFDECRCGSAPIEPPTGFAKPTNPPSRPQTALFPANHFHSFSLSSLNHIGVPSACTLPICVPSIASATERQNGYRRFPTCFASSSTTVGSGTADWLASTPMKTCMMMGHSHSLYQPTRSYSTDCFRPHHVSYVACTSCGEVDGEPIAQPVWQSNVASFNGRWRTNSSTSGSTDSQVGIDPQRLASLSNTAHLIKLLNQILNDRQMDPRKKMKCILDFRKTHADVYWLRFGDQQTESNYLARLQRRIDGQPQPTVLERITNAFRRRRLSPQRLRSTRQESQSPSKSTGI
ncbi:unnamed protein product [Dicrocoelium dendriticum]|nr:unnamed protein product [Dicrocoelium dendriticum]CAH8513314.1 unnamed protein product [Dicrocoelium dendriticum]